MRDVGDIEIEFDGPQHDEPDAPTQPSRRLGVVAVAVVAALVIAAFAVGRSRPSTDDTTAPTTTTAAPVPTTPTSVERSSGMVIPYSGVYVVVIGRKVLTGPSLRDLELAAVMAADEPLPWVADRWLVLPNGRPAVADTAGDTHTEADTGLWIIDLAGRAEPRRIAPPSRAVPSVEPYRLWVQEGAVAQELTFDGTPLAAPLPVPGTLTGATADGLVSDDRGRVTFTDRAGASVVVGRGFTIDTDRTSVLWRSIETSLNRTTVPSLDTRLIADGTIFQRAWIAPAFVGGSGQRIDSTVVHGPEYRAAGFVEDQQLTVTGDGTATVSDRRGASTLIGVLQPAAEVRLIALVPAFLLDALVTVGMRDDAPLRVYVEGGSVVLDGTAGLPPFVDLGPSPDDPSPPLTATAVEGGVIAGVVADPSSRIVALQVGEGPPVPLALVDVEGQGVYATAVDAPVGTPFTVTTPDGVSVTGTVR